MDEKARTVLFLCTGNYFRSRYAEVFFNARAARDRLPWRATSRGLAVERGVNNVGPMALVAIHRLRAAGLDGPDLARAPAPVTRADLVEAARIVALKEAEHRPLVLERWPDFAARVEYGHVDDVDCCPADDALDAVERLVDRLVREARGRD